MRALMGGGGRFCYGRKRTLASGWICLNSRFLKIKKKGGKIVLYNIWCVGGGGGDASVTVVYVHLHLCRFVLTAAF